jgi:hypothetical protein
MTRYISAEKLTHDDFKDAFSRKEGEIVYDARMAGTTAWATMTEASFKRYGEGRLGTGFGQKYRRNAEGHLLKVEG